MSVMPATEPEVMVAVAPDSRFRSPDTLPPDIEIAPAPGGSDISAATSPAAPLAAPTVPLEIVIWPFDAIPYSKLSVGTGLQVKSIVIDRATALVLEDVLNVPVDFTTMSLPQVV